MYWGLGAPAARIDSQHCAARLAGGICRDPYQYQPYGFVSGLEHFLGRQLGESESKMGWCARPYG
jgi:hypothetical protein